MKKSISFNGLPLRKFHVVVLTIVAVLTVFTLSACSKKSKAADNEEKFLESGITTAPAIGHSGQSIHYP